MFGALLGVAAAFWPGGVFVFLLAGATCAALHRWGPERDRVFLIRLFLVAFILRVALSLALDLGSWVVEGQPPIQRGPPEYWTLGIFEKTRDYLRMGDSDAYSQRGYCLAEYVRGNREPVVLRRIQVYGYHAYVLVIGWFYYLFGFSPVSVKWVNGWIGSFHVLAIFYLARACFQSRIARWASVGVALFPTLVLWSATNLKEPVFFLSTTLLLALFMAFRAKRSLKRWALCGVAFLAILSVLQNLGRKEVGVSLVVGLLAAFCLEVCLRRRWYPLLLFLGIALLPFSPWVKIKQAVHLGLYRHTGYVHTESATYRFLPDWMYSSPIQLREGVLTDSDARVVISRVPLALTHYLLQPFPGLTGSRFALQVMMIPQMIGWYFALFFAALGVAAAVRWNLWRCGPLLAVGSIWVFMGALSSGNVGTLIRVRDMVTPIALIFSAAGLWALARGRDGFAQEAMDP